MKRYHEFQRLAFYMTCIALWMMLLLMLPDLVLGHARLVCPPPRSPDTGAKMGPCGGYKDDATMEALELEPGLQTIVWEESIYHFAAPARLALAFDRDEEEEEEDENAFESCVLLDHIPHGDTGLPKNMSYLDETTYVRYAVTVKIPNIRCERCQLQFMSAMTDFIHGVPPGTECSLSGESHAQSGQHVACPAVYYSCAPVRINGNGSSIGTGGESGCDLAATEEELQWPFHNNQQIGVYKFEGDEGNWTGNFPRVVDDDDHSIYGTEHSSAFPPVYAQRHGTCAGQAPELAL